jgi:hypothetical protein
MEIFDNTKSYRTLVPWPGAEAHPRVVEVEDSTGTEIVWLTPKNAAGEQMITKKFDTRTREMTQVSITNAVTTYTLSESDLVSGAVKTTIPDQFTLRESYENGWKSGATDLDLDLRPGTAMTTTKVVSEEWQDGCLLESQRSWIHSIDADTTHDTLISVVENFRDDSRRDHLEITGIVPGKKLVETWTSGFFQKREHEAVVSSAVV